MMSWTSALDPSCLASSSLMASILAGVVPLVERMGNVEPLVTLEADEVLAEHGGEDLGDLGLADAGLPLEEQRPSQLQREVHGHRQATVGNIVLAFEGGRDVLYRGGNHAQMVAGGAVCEIGYGSVRQVQAARPEQRKRARVEEVGDARGVDVGILLHLAGEEALIEACPHQGAPRIVAQAARRPGQGSDGLVEIGELAPHLLERGAPGRRSPPAGRHNPPSSAAWQGAASRLPPPAQPCSASGPRVGAARKGIP